MSAADVDLAQSMEEVLEHMESARTEARRNASLVHALEWYARRAGIFEPPPPGGCRLCFNMQVWFLTESRPVGSSKLGKLAAASGLQPTVQVSLHGITCAASGTHKMPVLTC